MEKHPTESISAIYQQVMPYLKDIDNKIQGLDISSEQYESNRLGLVQSEVKVIPTAVLRLWSAADNRGGFSFEKNINFDWLYLYNDPISQVLEEANQILSYHLSRVKLSLIRIQKYTLDNLCSYLEFPKLPSSAEEAFDLIGEIPHQHYVWLWLLGELSRREITWATEIAKIDLEEDGHDVVELPDNIKYLENLQTLRLGGTSTEYLTESIGCLLNLKHLDLNTTQLCELPQEIAQLSKLETLILDDTDLSFIPTSICSLTNLTTLSIRHLKKDVIIDIPQEIANLTNLKHLYVTSDGHESLTIAELKVLLPSCSIHVADAD